MNSDTEQRRSSGPTRRALERVIKSRPVAFHPDIARISGSAAAGLLLCQMLYWAGVVEDSMPERGGWFYKRRDELADETTLSRREQETARRRLRARGYIKEFRSSDFARLIWFRVNVEAVCRDLEGIPTPVNRKCHVEARFPPALRAEIASRCAFPDVHRPESAPRMGNFRQHTGPYPP